MVKGELLGQHAHRTLTGQAVQIWSRDGKFMARGRFARKQFGQLLGTDQASAASELRRLLVRLEDGSFVPPSESRRTPFPLGLSSKATIRELANAFLREKRSTRGLKTATDYKNRLVPLLEFAEQERVRRKYSLASMVDRQFAVEFRAFLQTRTVTPNGCLGSEKRISAGQIYNILDIVRSLFNWAKNPATNQLPSSFSSPFTKDIVGRRARKDPLRPIPLPQDARIALVNVMDPWQLSQFALPLVLPLRPEDFTGLLISDVHFQNRTLQFGFRAGGHDFNKGRQAYRTPFPEEILPLLHACIGGRTAGPVLRSRAACQSRTSPSTLALTTAEEVRHFERALAKAGTELQSEQDAKRLVRRAILEMGGVSGNSLAKEFKGLLDRIGLPSSVRFYDLRASCNTEMDRAGVSQFLQKYVTGHSTKDIQFDYLSFDLTTGMRKYFDALAPLLEAMGQRARSLGMDGKEVG